MKRRRFHEPKKPTLWNRAGREALAQGPGVLATESVYEQGDANVGHKVGRLAPLAGNDQEPRWGGGRHKIARSRIDIVP